MTLYCLDPGTDDSALVCLSPDGTVSGSIWRNDQLLMALHSTSTIQLPAHLVVEEVQSYGMPVGREVFATVFWSGRFVQAWSARGLRVSWSLLPRKDVKLALCGSPRAKDANIRKALIDRYGGPQATKKGGPLYGIKSHLWAGLALGVTYQDQQRMVGV